MQHPKYIKRKYRVHIGGYKPNPIKNGKKNRGKDTHTTYIIQ
jgi:hypothetical protein